MKAQKHKKVLKYNVVFQEEKESGYSVWVPELSGCASQGETFDEALGNIREAMELYGDYSSPKRNKKGYPKKRNSKSSEYNSRRFDNDSS